MIVLLPLRGWVGDAMAGQMLQQQLAGVASASAQVGPSVAHEDCMGHAAPADEAATPASPADCPTCASCQVCSPVALAFDATMPRPLTLVAPVPASPLARFASAEPAPAFKPPIS